MKIEKNEKALLFSETPIPDIFFAEHLSQIPGDYLKIYLYYTTCITIFQHFIFLN